jgi:hypothetical protein
MSEHFQLKEFEHDEPIPQAIVDSGIFEELAEKVLEPIRALLDNRPLIITSGYRSAKTNATIHGAPGSQHIATPFYAAADFIFETKVPTLITFRMAFDKIRMSYIPFNQLILEHGQLGTSIIHVSIDTSTPVREALEGATYNRTAYTRWDTSQIQESA